MGKRKNLHAGDNYNLCARPKHLGYLKYRVKGEPIYRVIEEVSSIRDAKARIRERHPGKSVDILSDIIHYEPYKDVYLRRYYGNILRDGDKNLNKRDYG